MAMGMTTTTTTTEWMLHQLHSHIQKVLELLIVAWEDELEIYISNEESHI